MGLFYVNDEQNQDLDLTAGTPTMLKAIYRKRWQQILDQEAAGPVMHKAAGQGEQVADILSKGLEMDIPRDLFRSAKMNYKEKRMIGLMLSMGQTWKQQQCPLCQQPDGVQHRLLSCPSMATQRKLLLPPCLQEQGNMMKTWGCRAKQPGSHRPEQAVYDIYPPEDPFCWDPDLPIYTDGSCWMPADKLLAKASAAAVQVTKQGLLIKSVTCVVA